ncbi:MAG: geopeptide radical SAM maturase [Thermodesulfovibrionales bacterium]
MQLSRYIKTYTYEGDPDYLVLYSTRRASTILLPKTALEQIEKGELEPSDQEVLFDLGFLVPDRDEEKKEMLGLIDVINKRARRFNAIVVMNLDCNLRCTYCYEGNMKGERYMSAETLGLLADFLEKHALSRGKDVHIDFYGGEPLLSFDDIRRVSERLKSLSAGRGLTYSFNLVTNGTLLTRARTKELAALGMKSARITLDGPKGNHDAFRPFKSGSGTFETIVKNIRDVYDILSIQIGGNYTQENYTRFPELLDYLIAEGLSPDKFLIVKFDPVVKPGGRFALPEFRDGSESINEPWIFRATLFLREEILKRGFKTPKILPSPCMIGLTNDVVVNYDGTIYKCPGFIGWEGFEAGDLRTGMADIEGSHALDIWKNEQCLDCEYLPLCFGGCRFMKVLRDGNIHEIDCKKPYLDATLETLVGQDIKYMPETGD